MEIAIRPVRVPEDLGRLVEIYNAIYPEPTTVERWLESEADPPEDRIREWVVASVVGGHVAGYAVAERHPGIKAGVFPCTVRIDPECRNQGTGSSLLHHVESWAIRHGAATVRCSVREIHPESVAFAQKRGYRIQRHIFESTLDLSTFDESRFAGVIEQAEASGIRFCSLADRHDSKLERQLYEVDRRAQQDMPGYDRPSFIPFEQWRRGMLGAEDFRPDCFLFAKAGDQVVALTQLSHDQQPGAMRTMITGVLPEFRGRHLALALKLLSVRRARACGAAVMRTNNDSTNAPMLAVNRNLGYVPGPGIYVVGKQV